MTKPREKTREELQAEIEGAKDPPINSSSMRQLFYGRYSLLRMIYLNARSISPVPIV